MIGKGLSIARRGDPLPLAMIIGLLQSFSIGSVSLGIVYYAADRFLVGSALIGLLAAISTGSYALSCFVLNKPISRLKPYHAIILGVSSQMILAQIAFRVPSLAALAVVFLFFGLSTGFIWPPLMGWMSRGRDGAHLNKAMSAYNFSWSIPWMLSPFFTGLLYETSPRLPFYFCTATSFLVIAVITVYLGLFKKAKESAQSEHHLKKAAAQGEDKSTPLRFLTWIMLFPSYMLIGIFGSIFPIFLRSNFTLPESQVGLIILIRAFVTIIVFFVMGRTVFWHFNKKVILAATPILAGLLLLFSGSHALWHYALWAVLTGIIIGFSYTQSMFHCLSGAVERQKRMNIHEIILTAAMLAGSILGGAFLDRFGMNFIVFFVAVAMAAAIPAQLLTDRTVRNKNNPRKH